MDEVDEVDEVGSVAMVKRGWRKASTGAFNPCPCGWLPPYLTYRYWDKISLVPCGICGRTFRPDAFEKHAKVCVGGRVSGLF